MPSTDGSRLVFSCFFLIRWKIDLMARRNWLWFTWEGKVLYLDVLFYSGIAKKNRCAWHQLSFNYFAYERRQAQTIFFRTVVFIVFNWMPSSEYSAFLYGLCVYILRVQHNLLNHSKYMWPPSKTFVLRFCWNFMFARRRNMISLLMTACLMTTTTNCKSNLSKFKVSIFGRFWSVTII
jgi:hypothetical protein